MAAKLQDDQKLKRLITVYGIPGSVEVTLTSGGLAFRVPGTKNFYTHLSWGSAVNASHTPGNAKSYHEGRPFEFLKSEAERVIKKRAEKESE